MFLSCHSMPCAARCLALVLLTGFGGGEAEARPEIAETAAGAPPLPRGFTAFGSMFAFTRHRTAFDEPATITLPFDLAWAPAGASPRLDKSVAVRADGRILLAGVGRDTADRHAFVRVLP